MSPDILGRAIWAIVIAGILIFTYWLVNRAIIVRAREKRLGLETMRSRIPAVLYFTTPTCVPCKTVQRPALARLSGNLGNSIQVIEIDASAQPELANYWGVLSVPTTFIIDSRGRPRRVNHGIASAEKLQQQIEQIEGKTYLPLFFQSGLRKLGCKRNYS